MATPTDIRRLALVALYQLDACSGEDRAHLRESLAETVRHSTDEELADDEGGLFRTPLEPFTDRDEGRAFDLAQHAGDARGAADEEFEALAPDWPPRRQAAIDRAILRLAHFEMVSGRTPPKVAVNEAVELARAFSTEKSPAFINGLLGKVLKRVLGAQAELPVLDEGTHPEATPLHLAGPAGSVGSVGHGPAGEPTVVPGDDEPGAGG